MISSKAMKPEDFKIGVIFNYGPGLNDLKKVVKILTYKSAMVVDVGVYGMNDGEPYMWHTNLLDSFLVKTAFADVIP